MKNIHGASEACFISTETLSTSHLHSASFTPLKCQGYTAELHYKGQDLHKRLKSSNEYTWAGAHSYLALFEIDFCFSGCCLLPTSSLFLSLSSKGIGMVRGTWTSSWLKGLREPWGWVGQGSKETHEAQVQSSSKARDLGPWMMMNMRLLVVCPPLILGNICWKSGIQESGPPHRTSNSQSTHHLICNLPSELHRSPLVFLWC